MKHLIAFLKLNVLLGFVPFCGFAQNLALNRPVTVSTVEPGTSYTGNLAVDGDYKSRWSSDHSDPQWLYVDLGATYNVTDVKVTWELASAKNYNIDVSTNASTWTTIKSITSNTSLTNDNAVSASGRYVRIYGTARTTIYGYSIYELEVYGSSGSGSGSGSGGSGSGGSGSGSGSGGITTAAGKTYYFSSSTGDDSRSSTQAQSSATPWKTLSKLNSFASSLQPGDLVLFKRGDTFYGSINLTNSGSSGLPIAFSAYGTGAKPNITGFATISSWSSIGNNLYTASVPGGLSTLNMVARNGNFQAMGKYPKGNTGYYTVSSLGSSSLSSSGISGIPSFVGGEVVWRAYHWVLWRGTVTAQSSSTVSYSAFPSASGGGVESPQVNYGFFFQNHPSACTALGDWAFNSSSHVLTMNFSSSAPGSNYVQASSIDNLITVSNKSYITFDNLAVTGANADAFALSNSNNILFNACDIAFSGHDGIMANSGCSNIKVTNCTVNCSNYNGIVGAGAPYWTITGSTISNSATVAGMGGSGEGQYCGIISVGSGSLISQNVITGTGYNALSFQGPNNTIQNNFIDSFCTVKDDGGGIYSGAQNFSGSKVINNIVLHGLGQLKGTPDPDGRTHGIYLDDGGSNLEIGGNTMAFCDNSGVYNHNGQTLNIHNNTSFDNLVTGIKYYNDGNSISNLTLTNNIFFAKTTSELVARSSGGVNGPASFFATADNNYYCRPMNESSDFLTLVPSVTNYSLSTWKILTGKEANSHSSPVAVSNVNNIRFEYNASSSNKTVNLGATYMDVKGVSYAGSITLGPYASAVLIYISGSTQAVANTTEIVDPATLNAARNSFVIYPDPVADNITLQIDNAQTGKMNVQIVNTAGQLMRSMLLNKDQQSTTLNVTASDLPKGVYFMRVQVGTWKGTKQFVKL